MAGNQRLQAALTGVTAAVVGVVLNLAVWFGHKVMLPDKIQLFGNERMQGQESLFVVLNRRNRPKMTVSAEITRAYRWYSRLCY